ncbi:MAG: hypothetical protein IPL42_01285 [Saprospiraceae bacterium]|nr:hypothetical protein [Saprospiraceae bacterium]
MKLTIYLFCFLKLISTAFTQINPSILIDTIKSNDSGLVTFKFQIREEQSRIIYYKPSLIVRYSQRNYNLSEYDPTFVTGGINKVYASNESLIIMWQSKKQLGPINLM